MRNHLIQGRMSEDSAIGQRIQVVFADDRYAVERDTRHDTTVLYRNVNSRMGIPPRWEVMTPDALDATALYRLATRLAWQLSRTNQLRAVS